MALVFLSAGHGGSDPGAVANGIQEKNANLDIMMACKESLEAAGVGVVCSRTRDENDPVGEEVNEANASGADVAVSFHNNAGGGHGSECYYYASDKKGKRLAQLIEEAAKGLGQTSRGIKSGNNLYFVRKTNMTAVLSETAFLDSDDVQDIDTLGERQAFGRAYASAIIEWLKEYDLFNGQTPANPEPAPAPAPAENQNGGSFKVKISISNLNIRKGPGTNYPVVGMHPAPGVYTIVDTSSGQGSDAGWGLLKSYANKRDGWVSLDYAKRM